MQFRAFGLTTRKRRSRSYLSECNSSLSDWQPESEDRDLTFRNAILRFRIGNPKAKIAILPFGMQFFAFGLATRKRRSRSYLSECNSSLSDWQPESEDRDLTFRNAILPFRIGISKAKIAILPFGMQFFAFGLTTRKQRSRSCLSECD